MGKYFIFWSHFSSGFFLLGRTANNLFFTLVIINIYFAKWTILLNEGNTKQITNHRAEKSDCHAVYLQPILSEFQEQRAWILESLRDIKLIHLAKLWFELPCYEFKVAAMITNTDFECFQINYTRLSLTRILTRLTWIYQVAIHWVFFIELSPEAYYISSLAFILTKKEEAAGRLQPCITQTDASCFLMDTGDLWLKMQLVFNGPIFCET